MAMNHTGRLSPWLALGFQGGILLLALAALWLFSIPVSNDGLSALPALLLGALGGVVTWGLLYALTLLPMFRVPVLKTHMRDLHRFTRSYSWTVLVGLAVLAGAGEELLFRAVVQGGLADAGYLLTGLLVGSVLFGLVHFLSWAYFAMATLLGLVLGVAYWQSGSLLLVMVWHGVYDLVAIFMLRQYPQAFGLPRA